MFIANATGPVSSKFSTLVYTIIESSVVLNRYTT